jgi:tetratricopeptide (TPR) repeat protein
MLTGMTTLETSAQAVTIIGSGQDARNCSFAAETAATLQTASRDDLETCTRALDHGSLQRGDQAATFTNRGIVQSALERYEDALKDYERALAISPDLPEAFVGRGNAYFLMGDTAMAVADYSEALALNLREAHLAHFNLGLAYEKQNKLDDAEQSYRSALALAPQFTLAQQKLDAVLAKKQRAQTAPTR